MKAVLQSSSKIKLFFKNGHEEEDMRRAFTKKIKNAYFRTKGRGWDGSVEFITRSGTTHAGMWYKLIKTAERLGFKLETQGFDNLFYTDINKKQCDEFVDHIMSGIPDVQTRPYQYEATFKAYKYLYCSQHLATAAGKTLIMFLTYIILIKQKKLNKLLIIAPDSDLVIQGYNDWLHYAQGRFDIRAKQIHGKSKSKDISDIKAVFGNFQTLINRPPEFFHDFSHIFIDEAHKIENADSKSIKKIADMCVNKVSCKGFSGSLKTGDGAESFTVEAYTGPIVAKVTKKQLMDAGWATPIEIHVIVLDYLTQEEKWKLAVAKETNQLTELSLYEYEMSIIRNNKLRNDWIAKFLATSSDNTLAFFIDVKNQYGAKMLDAVRKIKDKWQFFYIDGDVKSGIREAYKERLENYNNCTLFATYNTFGTGKSVNNLHRFVCIEPYKSETIINQATGRGMRLLKGKDKFIWVDIVDDFRISGKHDIIDINFTNILYKQATTRKDYYRSEGFSYTTQKIKLSEDVKGSDGESFF